MYERYKSCLSLKDLEVIARDYNKTVHPMHRITENKFKSFKLLHEALGNKFAHACDKNDTECWIGLVQDPNKTRILLNNFRPPMDPVWKVNRNTLLNTTDIMRALKPYEKQYNDFHFLGVFPLDFTDTNSGYFSNNQCVVGNLCRFDIRTSIKNKKTQFGLVVNLDKYGKPGSHWVAVYINVDKKDPRYGFHFYDSYGRQEPVQIQTFYKRIAVQLGNGSGASSRTAIPFNRNTTRHQYKFSECGMFSMVFIILCLENKITIADIFNKKLYPGADDAVNVLRPILYKSK